MLNSVSAIEMCALRGDFVPWPWAQEYYSQVIGQKWKIMDESGIEHSEIVFSLSESYFRWGNKKYTLVEESLVNEQVRLGVSRVPKEKPPLDVLVFDMLNTTVKPFAKQKYHVNIGYWESSKDQMTVEEHDDVISRFSTQPNFNLDSDKVCTPFRQRTDHVVGLVLTVETETPDGIDTNVLYGLTEDPIYTLD